MARSSMSQNGPPARACCTTTTAHAFRPTPMILPSRCLAPRALTPPQEPTAAVSGLRLARQSVQPKLLAVAKRADGGDDDVKVVCFRLECLRRPLWLEIVELECRLSRLVAAVSPVHLALQAGLVKHRAHNLYTCLMGRHNTQKPV